MDERALAQATALVVKAATARWVINESDPGAQVSALDPEAARVVMETIESLYETVPRLLRAAEAAVAADAALRMAQRVGAPEKAVEVLRDRALRARRPVNDLYAELDLNALSWQPIEEALIAYAGAAEAGVEALTTTGE